MEAVGGDWRTIYQQKYLSEWRKRKAAIKIREFGEIFIDPHFGPPPFAPPQPFSPLLPFAPPSLPPMLGGPDDLNPLQGIQYLLVEFK